MKSIVIGLVVVIVALGGLQVAQSEDLKQIQEELERKLEDEYKLRIGLNMYFSSHPDGYHTIEIKIYEPIQEQTLKKMACEAAQKYSLRTGFPPIHCRILHRGYTLPLDRIKLWVIYDNRGCHLRD